MLLRLLLPPMRLWLLLPPMRKWLLLPPLLLWIDALLLRLLLPPLLLRIDALRSRCGGVFRMRGIHWGLRVHLKQCSLLAVRVFCGNISSYRPPVLHAPVMCECCRQACEIPCWALPH